MQLEAQVAGLRGGFFHHAPYGVIADPNCELSWAGFRSRSGLEIGDAVLGSQAFHFGGSARNGKFESHWGRRRDQVLKLVEDECRARNYLGLSHGNAGRTREKVDLLGCGGCDVQLFAHVRAAFNRDLVIAGVTKFFALKLNVIAKLYLAFDRGTGTNYVQRCFTAS